MTPGNIGRVTEKRARRAIANPRETELWCRDFVATVINDANGNPTHLRRRCKNRGCCRPKHGTIAIHVWDLRTGLYTTEEVPQY